MPRSTTVRAGILFAVLPWLAISCGTKIATQPSPNQSITSVPAGEQYLNSPQQEHRELLVDGRATPIEWNLAGSPTYVLLHGIGGGGDYLAAVRSIWSYDRFGAPQAIYFLLQWPDPTFSALDHPCINDSADILDEQGNLLVNCRAGNDILVRPTTWHLGPSEEDQLTVKFVDGSLETVGRQLALGFGDDRSRLPFIHGGIHGSQRGLAWPVRASRGRFHGGPVRPGERSGPR